MENENNSAQFSRIPDVLEDMKQGRFVVVVDDEDRENEGDLVLPAEHVTPQKINFLLTHARGVICVAISRGIADSLDLPPMVQNNRSRYGTPFTVSVDARQGIETGVSADDRAETVRVLASEDSGPGDLVRPGHVFPLVAREGGALVRAGHTEAAVDLCRMADLRPAAVVCEVMNDDGSMARLPDLEEMATEFGFKICTTADIIRHRHQSECLVEKTVCTEMPTPFGHFKLHYFRSRVDDQEHIAICCGGVGGDDTNPGEPEEEPVLVRVHDACFTGDVLGSMRCDCGQQLHRSLEMIQEHGRGVVLYMRQEGRGIGLENKLHAYSLQDQGMDTVEANEELGFPADMREYGIGAQILRHLGVRQMKLISNNPKKFHALSGYGLQVLERIPIEISPNEANEHYLRTKREKMSHMLRLDEDDDSE
ncbi:MAG: bifunctional 3,4-dihydroxy-2-butanone-4-phosphate synthase/GTP cyclohydrolase II [Planctomycetota bacterium]